MIEQDSKENSLGRIISPPKEDWNILRQPLEIGERRFVEYLDKNLDNEWEIYIQPSLNGLCPDIIILHPKKGICIFEVKNWDFNAINYETYTASNGKKHLKGTSVSQGNFKITKNPVDQIMLYRKEMRQIYCPQLDTKSGGSILFCGLVFPSATKEQICKSIVPIFHSRGRNLTYDNQHSKYFIFTEEDFSQNIQQTLPRNISSQYSNSSMNEKIAEYLRFWLVEPDAPKEQRIPLKLDAKQFEIASTRTLSGYRRLKGPAGSGKSLVIAKRVAILLGEEKTVLVVTFNITLINYLSDLAVRDYPKARKEAVWLNFHFLASRICIEAGLEEEYNELFFNIKDGEFIDNNKLCDLVERALKINDFSKFDAILVDEGQDYNPRWWSILRKILKDGGEMLLVADTTQDIYGQGKLWTDQAMSNAGFTGSWSTLDNTYRLPHAFIPMVQDFAKQFIPEASVILPLPVKDENQDDLFSNDKNNADNFIFKWIQVPSSRTEIDFSNILKEPVKKFQSDLQKLGLSFSDQTFLVSTHEVGTWLTNFLKKEKYSVTDIFSKDWKESRRKKQYFFKGSQSVKACTIHSYKGWESRALFVFIDNLRAGTKDAEVFYTALTRLKGGGKCIIYILCSDYALAEFGKNWSEYYNDTVI